MQVVQVEYPTSLWFIGILAWLTNNAFFLWGNGVVGTMGCFFQTKKTELDFIKAEKTQLHMYSVIFLHF